MLYRNSGDSAGYLRWYSHYVTTTGSISSYYAWPGISGLEVGKWYHIVISRTGNGALKIYLNGKEISSYGPPANFDYWSTNSNGVSIGSERAGSSWWNNSGFQIDDVRIYGQALSQAQIQKLYAEGAERRELLVVDKIIN